MITFKPGVPTASGAAGPAPKPSPPPGYWQTGIADPPWEERGGGKSKRGADRHYKTLSVKEICDLQVYGRHVSQLFAPKAHLYLWVTNNFLEEAFKVVKAWQFQYVTCVTWGKVNDKGHVQTGLGQYFRGASEQLLFCRRGVLPYRKDPVTGLRAQGKTLILHPRLEHSEKPEVFRKEIEKVSYGPYIELFARRATKNWTVWGNQAPEETGVGTFEASLD